MWPNPLETADLVKFTEEIRNGKLHFFCAVHVKVWTCSHFDIDSVICKVFMCWEKNLSIGKAPFFIFQNSLVIFWVFCSCHRNAPMRSIKFYLVGEFLSRKKNLEEVAAPKETFWQECINLCSQNSICW